MAEHGHLPVCRFCATELRDIFADLGMSPPSNSFLTASQLSEPEAYFPLRAMVCANCLLVQLEAWQSPADLFSDYAYYSSYSTTWLDHSQSYAKYISERLSLGATDTVVELASNDGYLLQYFAALGIGTLGIEPASNVAQSAIGKGLNTVIDFFGTRLAEQLVAEVQPRLIVANNVLAQVPDLNDFVRGIKLLLNPTGVATLEFPHLLQLMDRLQFDTIYHEHFSYFSLTTARTIFTAHGLRLFDVDEISTHGGSLRIYVCHEDSAEYTTRSRVASVLQKEKEGGLDHLERYTRFGVDVAEEKRSILSFFILKKREGARIAGYGAPAKGNTLLTYCGMGRDFLDFTVDKNPHKQGRYLPGTHIPIWHPNAIREYKPDLVFILPWNIQEEVLEELKYVRQWGGACVVRQPGLTLR